MQVEQREGAIVILQNLIANSKLREYRVLIGGPVNSGKSTFARDLVNQLLEQTPQVAWLDCDVGQPEFTPSSLVSLHIIKESITGNPLDHLSQPFYQCFVGSNTPKTEPEYYIECVHSLLFRFQEFVEEQNVSYAIPLVINTNGWIRGNGGKILSILVDRLQPHASVQLLSADYIALGRNLIDFRTIVPESEVITLKSFSSDIKETEVPSESSTTGRKSKYIIGSHSKVSAKQMRELIFMKYFQCDRIPLSHNTPYKVPWKYIRIRFLYDEVLCSMALHALNGMVVGLACDPSKYQHVGDKIDIHAEYPQFLQSTPICECVGLGIIRAIDPKQRLFYVLTPVALKDLARVNTFMKGHVELPTLALLEGGVMNAPYLCSNALSISDGSGAAPMSKKRPTIPRNR